MVEFHDDEGHLSQEEEGNSFTAGFPSSTLDIDSDGDDREIQADGRVKRNAAGKVKKKNKSGGFQTMGFSKPILSAVLDMGYRIPTPIQRKAIPVLLNRRDCVAMARTGSGKTAAFMLPILQMLGSHSMKVGIRALVIAPTRELALQLCKFAQTYARKTNLRMALIVGGDGIEAQFAALSANPDVLVATPGRLMHIIEQTGLSLQAVKHFVMDEADQLFEMGVTDQLNAILARLPSERQTVLFSATLPRTVVEFARIGLYDPELIRLDLETRISPTLSQTIFTPRSSDKIAALLYLFQHIIPAEGTPTVVFAATRYHVEYISQVLKHNNYSVSMVYGGMEQSSRKMNIAKFSQGLTQVLVVTDVAARGIDIPLLDVVVNYHFPPTPKLYVHRVGRAGRAGRSGAVYSFASPGDEFPYVVDTALYLGAKLLNSPESGESLLTEGPVPCDNPLPAARTRVGATHWQPSRNVILYGGFPQGMLDTYREHVVMLHDDGDVLMSFTSSENAWKMFKRTRAQPSGSSVRRKKKMMFRTHPLVVAWAARGVDMGITRGEEEDALLNALANYRPTQTVMEIHKSRRDPTKQLLAEKRAFHGKAIEKSKAATLQMEQEDAEFMDKGADTAAASAPVKVVKKAPMIPTATSTGRAKIGSKGKVRLSKAARKKLKKANKGESAEDASASMAEASYAAGLTARRKRAAATTGGGLWEEGVMVENMGAPPQSKRTGRDAEFFMDDSKANQKVSEFEKGLELTIASNDVVLGVGDDDATGMRTAKRRQHIWDRRKKKYVLAEGSGNSSMRHVKTESGARARVTDEKKKTAFYDAWVEKTHSKLQQVGDLEHSTIQHSAAAKNSLNIAFMDPRSRGKKARRGADALARDAIAAGADQTARVEVRTTKEIKQKRIDKEEALLSIAHSSQRKAVFRKRKEEALRRRNPSLYADKRGNTIYTGKYAAGAPSRIKIKHKGN